MIVYKRNNKVKRQNTEAGYEISMNLICTAHLYCKENPRVGAEIHLKST